ncbi:MAG: hypothetical protein J6R20_01735 [Clostridia bacterium]|nr:hypothetical protein [Clostridia bacterium]
MKKAVAMILAIILIAFSFTSCSDGSFLRPADSLLVPPLFYEEYEGLVELFRSQIGDGVSLCTPYDGDYRSAIIVEDFDGDMNDEAMIFYRDSSADSNAKARSYEIKGDEWTLAADFNGHGNQVESVSVRDMNGDGISEIIVSWSVSGISSSKTLSVYHSPEVDAPYKEISNEVCSVSMIVDVDGDSLDDIFLITAGSGALANAKATPQRFARLIGVSNGAAVLKGEARVDANISGYSSVKTEKVEDDEPLKIFIDAMKGDKQMITELIYWDENSLELVAPLFDSETMSNTRTLRNEPIASTDINGDGRIDVPSQIEIFSSNANEMTIDPQHFYITSWLNFYEDGFSTLINTLVNYADGYMLVIEGADRYNLVVEDYRDLNCWIVKEKNEQTGESTELYSILRISNEKSGTTDLENHIPLIVRDEYTVYAYINQNGAERGITDSELKTKILPLIQK